MGSGTKKKAGSGEVRCVAGTVPALLQSGVRRHFIRRIINIIPLITVFECSFRESNFYHVISSASPRFRTKCARPLSFMKAHISDMYSTQTQKTFEVHSHI